MREIKFRGKWVNNGEWVYGSLSWGFSIHRQSQYRTIVNLIGCNCIEVYEVTPETVGQFTGLRDKNGRDIYEGDIQESSNSYKAVIEFKNGIFGINPIRNLNENSFIDLAIYLHTDEEGNALNIIGNIHENPELL